jgi:hypothetical protein
MNLIEQLKQTPKWGKFEKWFDTTYTQNYLLQTNDVIEYPGTYLEFEYWCDFPFEMQEGVFKKFIEFQNNWNYVFIQYKDKIEEFKGNQSDVCYNFYYTDGDDLSEDAFEIDVTFDTFEQLILWYFNN